MSEEDLEEDQETVYEEDGREDLMDEGEITPEEDGFMKGYEEADDDDDSDDELEF